MRVTIDSPAETNPNPMFLKIVYFVVLEGCTFFVVAIGAFILSHLGLLLIERVDAFLSRESSRPGSAVLPAVGSPPVEKATEGSARRGVGTP